MSNSIEPRYLCIANCSGKLEVQVREKCDNFTNGWDYVIRVNTRMPSNAYPGSKRMIVGYEMVRNRFGIPEKSLGSIDVINLLLSVGLECSSDKYEMNLTDAMLLATNQEMDLTHEQSRTYELRNAGNIKKVTFIGPETLTIDGKGYHTIKTKKGSCMALRHNEIVSVSVVLR